MISNWSWLHHIKHLIVETTEGKKHLLADLQRTIFWSRGPTLPTASSKYQTHTGHLCAHSPNLLRNNLPSLSCQNAKMDRLMWPAKIAFVADEINSHINCNITIKIIMLPFHICVPSCPYFVNDMITTLDNTLVISCAILCMRYSENVVIKVYDTDGTSENTKKILIIVSHQTKTQS